MSPWVPNTPKIVRDAITFKFTGICLQVISIYVSHRSDYPDLGQKLSRPGAEALTLIMSLLIGPILLITGSTIILFLISRRKNWARILWLAILILRLPYVIRYLPSFGGFTLCAQLFSLCGDVYLGYACFISKGRSWFRKVRQPSS